MNAIKKVLPAMLALVFVAGACSGSEDTTTTEDPGTVEAETDASEEAAAETDDAEEAEADTEAISLTITAVSFSSNTVTIRNDGSAPVDLDGWSICNRPNYTQISGVVEPGGTLDIDVSALNLDASSAEFGLYDSSDFGNAESIKAYVQWGEAGHGRASVAEAAGLIEPGAFVDNAGADFTQ